LKRFPVLLCILLTVALLFACAVLIFTHLQTQRTAEETQEAFRQHNREKDDYQQKIYTLEQQIQTLKDEMAEMEKLIALFDKKDELYAEMNSRLIGHQQKLAEAEVEIARLNADLEKLTVVCNIDMNAQRRLLDELEELLKNPPKKETKVEIPSETKEDDRTEESEVQYETVISDATISLYYCDLENGYTYSYNADEVYDSASLIKLPLALSLLQPTDGTDYDFSEVFTFDPENADKKATEGSGEIKKIKAKTDFTYLELFEYMMRYSDNVAFTAIKDKFSYTPLRNWCSVKGINSMLRHGLSNLSAEDGGSILAETYRFINENALYGVFFGEWMENSSHAVMIDYGAHPKRVAHKYGWDENAYHDMAIVYDEHPYTLVILSDLHQGGKDVNAYIQSLVKLVDDFHENFYKVK